jgi:hypothetical protein
LYLRDGYGITKYVIQILIDWQRAGADYLVQFHLSYNSTFSNIFQSQYKVVFILALFFQIAKLKKSNISITLKIKMQYYIISIS